MPATGPQKPSLPRHWKKQHLDIYRDLQSVETSAEIFDILVKYQRLKNNGAVSPSQEVIDIHIEVTRHILEVERCIKKTVIDEALKKRLKRFP